VQDGGHAFVSDIRLHRMGVGARKGAYPMHWHLTGQRAGDYIRNSVITYSNHR
jgi:hypothetical protein